MPNDKEILSDINIKSLKKYCKEHKLKKAILTFIVNDSDVKNLKEIFENLDENKDGTLNLNEIKKEIKK